MSRSSSSQLGLAIATLTVAVLVQRLRRWRSLNSSNAFKEKYPKPASGEADWLNEDQYAVLVAIADAFVPKLNRDEVAKQCWNMNIPAQKLFEDLFDLSKLPQDVLKLFQLGALERNVHFLACKLLNRVTTDTEKKDLVLLLNLLSSSVGCFAVTGLPCPFHQLSIENRVLGLKRLQTSIIADLRVAFQTFKRLIMSIFLDTLTREEWGLYAYDPDSTVSKPSRLVDTLSYVPAPSPPTNLIAGDVWELDTEVVVVGSGAGGGVMASELVKAGVKVLVLEKGEYYRTEDFKRWRQGEAQEKLFEKSAMCQSKTGSVAILAGSCVGGGTTLNWMASFRTPRNVLADWAAMGLPQFAPNGIFHASLDAIHTLVNVNTRFSYREDDQYAPSNLKVNEDCDLHFGVNGNNHALWRGAKECGFVPERIPRNVKACVDCGHCGFGCPYFSKQSTLTALMEPLGATGLLSILPQADVRVISRDASGLATGVEGTVLDKGSGAIMPFRVRAKVVVVSAGALHTPAVLLRSGFKNKKIGKHLTLHPVVGCAGATPGQHTGLQSGVSMGVVVKNSPSLELPNDPGWGVAIETPPVNLNLVGLVLSWNSGLYFKIQSLVWKNLLVYIGISRDHSKESNRVDIDKDGNFEVHYDLTKADEANLMNGLIQQVRIMRSTPGNKMIQLSHETFDTFVDLDNDDAFEAFLDRIRAAGIARGKYNVFSAHQMGSCRLAATPENGPVSPSGCLFECENVFVADASLFPTALGVNPMITVEALSHMVSRSVMKRLNVKPGALQTVPSEW